ncbi:MAG: 3-phosphoshikimate 1-carboxyvinyltransferase [Thermodesulfobacteriota bacterium]
MKIIKPITAPKAQIILPGSKSYTQRAMILAALAEGESTLVGPLLAEDTEYLQSALRLLGAEIVVKKDQMIVRGTGGQIQNPGQEIFLGNNGTAMRLLTSLVCLGRGEFILTGAPRLLERPVAPLLTALKAMGIKATSRKREGFPPVVIQADGFPGGEITLRDLESSQYVSSLLISAPMGRQDLSLKLRGAVPSLPYIEMTRSMMKQFGVEVERPGPLHYRVRHGQSYQGISCRIEGDVSSASYFFLAAALSGGTIRVEPIVPQTLQGDIGFLEVLEKTGARVVRGDDWVEVKGGSLKSGDMVFDFGEMPDMVPSLAVLAACRPGKTIIINVAHLRLKESNRLQALAQELNRSGIKAEETPDGLIIEGGQPRGAEIETYDDHRIAMSFTVLGLVAPGMKIKNPDCVRKSFPGFWEEMEKLG